jgi:3-oxoacyl-[acyl-carrier protein] reductase
VTEEDWDNFLNTNLKGQFNTCHFFAPYMLNKRRGQDNRPDLGGGERRGALGPGAQYSASKGGIIGFTEALPSYLPDTASRQYILPGSIKTRMVHWRTEEQLTEYAKSIPIGRSRHLRGNAWGIAYLASPCDVCADF